MVTALIEAAPSTIATQNTALLSALIGGGTATLVAVLSHLLTRTRSINDWLRNRLYDASIELMEQYRILWWASHAPFWTEGSFDHNDETKYFQKYDRTAIKNACDTYRRASDKVKLLFPDKDMHSLVDNASWGAWELRDSSTSLIWICSLTEDEYEGDLESSVNDLHDKQWESFAKLEREHAALMDKISKSHFRTRRVRRRNFCANTLWQRKNSASDVSLRWH